MTAQQISKVWTVLSLALLYYALNTYLVTQGGSPIFGATLIVTKRIPAAMMAIPICSTLLLLSALIGMDHAAKNSSTWADRIPLLGFDHIDTKSREAKMYQGIILILMSVLPVIALVHFWSVFLEGYAVTTENPARKISSIWNWSELTSLNDPARICNLYDAAKGPSSCLETNTLLPGLEPTVFAVLTLASFFATSIFWLRIFRPGTRKGRTTTKES